MVFNIQADAIQQPSVQWYASNILRRLPDGRQVEGYLTALVQVCCLSILKLNFPQILYCNVGVGALLMVGNSSLSVLPSVWLFPHLLALKAAAAAA